MYRLTIFISLPFDARRFKRTRSDSALRVLITDDNDDWRSVVAEELDNALQMEIINLSEDYHGLNQVAPAAEQPVTAIHQTYLLLHVSMVLG